MYANSSFNKFNLRYGQANAQEGQYPNISAVAYKSASKLYDSTVNAPFVTDACGGVIGTRDLRGGFGDGRTRAVTILNVLPTSWYAEATSCAVHSNFKIQPTSSGPGVKVLLRPTSIHASPLFE